MTAQLGVIPLRVLLDVRNPYSYLALGPTRRLGEALGLEIDWLPLTTPPLKAPSRPGPDDDRGVRHRRARANAMARDIATYAEAQGLVIRDYYRAPNSEPASQGWLWLRDQHSADLPRYLDALFRAYWADSLDLSLDSIAALLDTLGLPSDAFLAWSQDEGASATHALAETLREAGLFQTPGFVVEDEVFYGRQHLPMIRWILKGRTGPVPI